MAKKRFAFREGARQKGDPQKIGEELETIRHAGQLTAEAVIKRARKSSSAMHSCFNWDDTVAAHRYRLMQARTLIRKIVVIEPNKRPIRQYVHIRNESKKRGRYESMEIVAKQMDLYQSGIELLQAKLTAAAESVQELREAAGVSKRQGAMALLEIIAKSLETAKGALRKLPS